MITQASCRIAVTFEPGHVCVAERLTVLDPEMSDMPMLGSAISGAVLGCDAPRPLFDLAAAIDGVRDSIPERGPTRPIEKAEDALLAAAARVLAAWEAFDKAAEMAAKGAKP